MSENFTWPGWKNTKVLGKGAFGSVYEITREEFGHTYKAALKVISIPQTQEEIGSLRDVGMDDEKITTYLETCVKNISSEFALMSSLKGNSNIVSYEDHKIIEKEYGFGWNILIRMELLTPLREYIKYHPLSKEDIVKMGIGLCRALEICKKKGILHRDIKPANIFVSEMGDYKLGDFGVSRTLEDSQMASTRVGTFHYMAPEIYKGKEYSHSADIYSLAMVMYQYLNGGSLPFLYEKTPTFNQMNSILDDRMSGKPIPAPKYGDEALNAIILKCLDANPEKRIQSAAELRKYLEMYRNNQIGQIYQMLNIDEEKTIVHQEPPVLKEILIPCPHCGTPQKEGVTYCSNCGKSMKEPFVPAPPRKNPLPFIIAGVFVFVCVLGGGFFMLSGDKKVKEETPVQEEKKEETKKEDKEEEAKEEKQIVEEEKEDIVNDEANTTKETPMIFGEGPAPKSNLGTYYVYVEKNYLALRTAKAFNASNEIAKMYSGDTVQLIKKEGEYWYVYVPSIGMYGYTNSNYLYTEPVVVQQQQASNDTYYASVATGYLALRNGMAYDYNNEIGKIWSGEPVEVLDTATGTDYWYVYAPTLDMYGYVNSNYLVK